MHPPIYQSYTFPMSKLKEIERQIATLSAEERAQLRKRLDDQDWKDWDAQIERDVAEGKLDSMMEEALEDLRAVRTRPL